MPGREGEEQPRPYNGSLETILGEQFSKWSHTRNVGTRRPRERGRCGGVGGRGGGGRNMGEEQRAREGGKGGGREGRDGDGIEIQC